MVNARPLATDDLLNFNVANFIAGNLLANDSDPDGQPVFLRFVDGIRIDAKSGPDTATYIEGEYGNFAFKPDGSFTYFLNPWHPAVIALGPDDTLVESLNYKMSDGSGGTDMGQLKLSIAGPPASLETLIVDFEDLSAGSTVLDGYEGFLWGDGWTTATDTGAEWEPGNIVGSPVLSSDSIERADGSTFTLAEIDMKSLVAGESVRLLGYVDGIVRYTSTYTTFGEEPGHFEPDFVGIDRLEIIGNVLVEEFRVEVMSELMGV